LVTDQFAQIALPALMLQVLRAGDHPECFEPIMNIYYKSRTNLFEVEVCAGFEPRRGSA
jgi:hypothetical protein